MNPKQLHFDSEGREKLLAGISQIAKAVKSTLGPRGNTVLIESPEHTHGITVTKDGVTVAKSIFLMDEVENLAVRIMKEAADRTATTAGDGTTTAIVLTEALVKVGMELIDEDANTPEVLSWLQKECDAIVKSLHNKELLLCVLDLSPALLPFLCFVSHLQMPFPVATVCVYS